MPSGIRWQEDYLNATNVNSSSISEDLLLHHVTLVCVQLLKLSFSDQLLKQSYSSQSSAVAAMLVNVAESKQ